MASSVKSPLLLLLCGWTFFDGDTAIFHLRWISTSNVIIMTTAIVNIMKTIKNVHHDGWGWHWVAWQGILHWAIIIGCGNHTLGWCAWIMIIFFKKKYDNCRTINFFEAGNYNWLWQPGSSMMYMSNSTSAVSLSSPSGLSLSFSLPPKLSFYFAVSNFNSMWQPQPQMTYTSSVIAIIIVSIVI